MQSVRQRAAEASQDQLAQHDRRSRRRLLVLMPQPKLPPKLPPKLLTVLLLLPILPLPMQQPAHLD